MRGPSLRRVLVFGVLVTAVGLSACSGAPQPEPVRSEDDRVLEAGASVVASLDRDGDRRTHTVIGVEGQRLAIDVEGLDPGFDAFVRVYDPGGEQIAADDDGGSGLDSRVTVLVTTTGRHLVEVGTYNDADSGAYRLSVALDRDPTFDDADVVLQRQGEVGAGGSEATRFPFQADVGDQLLIEVLADGDRLDPVVEIRGPAGELVGTDDDGGDGFNAELRVRAAASGTHVAVVMAFGDSTGPFTIRVSVSPAPKGQLAPDDNRPTGGLTPGD